MPKTPVTGYTNKMSEDAEYVLNTLTPAIALLQKKSEVVDDLKLNVQYLIQKDIPKDSLLYKKIDSLNENVISLNGSIFALSNTLSKLLLATTNMSEKVDADATPTNSYKNSFLNDL